MSPQSILHQNRPLAFIDCETTGLNTDIHHPWEIAVIIERPGESTLRKFWMVPVDLTYADSKALDIGGYWKRYPQTRKERRQHLNDPYQAAAELAPLLAEAIVIGSNPDFDRAMISRWLRNHGQVWAAHHQTVNVATLAAGFLYGSNPDPVGPDDDHAFPLRSQHISRSLGVEPDNYARHTAAGDAAWARELFYKVVRPTSQETD